MCTNVMSWESHESYTCIFNVKPADLAKQMRTAASFTVITYLIPIWSFFSRLQRIFHMIASFRYLYCIIQVVLSMSMQDWIYTSGLYQQSLVVGLTVASQTVIITSHHLLITKTQRMYRNVMCLCKYSLPIFKSFQYLQ